MSESIIQDIQHKLNNKEVSCVQLVQEKIDALNASTKNANNQWKSIHDLEGVHLPI